MSNRGLTTAQLAVNTDQSVIYHELLYIRTRESGTSNYDYTYLTNAPYNIKVTAVQAVAMGLPISTAQTFLAVGPFLQFSTIEESADFQITSVTVSLGGMRGEDLALFLTNQYIDQPVKVWRVWLDSDGHTVDDPVLIFSGNIDKPVITDDPEGAVTIGCSASSQWITYTRTNGRHTNNDEQQTFYPNDTIFKFAADAIKDLKWGG
jgi:hypothetical protein